MQYREIIERLQENNCKITPQRKDIIKILIQAKTHLSAREILYRLRRKRPRLSFDTVYRNLAILKEIHIINQLDFQDGKSYFELNRNEGHHHHIICLKCGGTWRMHGCPMDTLTISNLPDNFRITNHRFELYGYCEDCRD